MQIWNDTRWWDQNQNFWNRTRFWYCVALRLQTFQIPVGGLTGFDAESFVPRADSWQTNAAACSMCEMWKHQWKLVEHAATAAASWCNMLSTCSFWQGPVFQLKMGNRWKKSLHFHLFFFGRNKLDCWCNNDRVLSWWVGGSVWSAWSILAQVPPICFPYPFLSHPPG